MPSLRRPRPSRFSEMRQILERRRHELVRRMSVKMDDVRTEGERARHAAITDGFAPTDVLDDLDTALIHMNSDTLDKIDTALRRMDQGQYGICSECGDDIAPPRLLAVPFAMRCIGCEDAYERARSVARHGGLSQSSWKE